MENPILVKSFAADGAVNPHRIVISSDTDGSAAQAAGPNFPFLGVSMNVDVVADGDTLDVMRQGIAEIEYGGVVSKGDALTADSVGRAVAAEFDSDDAVFVIGYAEYDGVSGDIRPVEIQKAIVPNSVVATETDLLVANVTLTAAQVKALNGTPIQVIAAPGANKANIVVGFVAYMLYNSAAFVVASNKDIALRFTDGSGAVQATLETTGFLDATSTQVRYVQPATANLTPVANAAVVAHMTTGEVTTGDSAVKLRVLYRVVDTVL